MKNALNYYYDLNPTSIHQINKEYRCFVGKDEYLLTVHEKTEAELKEIYKLNNILLQNGIPCHQILLNKQNQITTLINKEKYVFMKIFVNNRTININDIKYFSSIIINDKMFAALNKSNWYKLWTRKIDYLEYQISQFGKRYPLIRESISYYIGLSETAIGLLGNLNTSQQTKLVVSHRRINKNESTLEFYNPLNFILDYQIRDFSEYIKEQFFSDNYSLKQFEHDLYNYKYSQEEYLLLFARMFLPTYYFDCYEKIIFENKAENEILKIINKNHKYLEFLFQMYLIIKRYAIIPEIEWVIKK